MSSELASRAGRGMPARPDPDVLDLAHLQRYSMGDRALEADLLVLFRTQVTLQAGAIAASGDAESWKFATHTLKGVARTLGAWQIARTADALEALGHDGEVSQRSRLIADLDAQIARCERAMDGLG